MKIVDTHVHVISADRKRYPFSGDPTVRAWFNQLSATSDELLAEMDAAGVERTVISQSMSAYGTDNRYGADTVQKYPDRFAAVGIVDMLASDGADKVSYWAERGLSGLRLFTTVKPEATWLDDPRTYPIWERVRSLGQIMTIMMTAQQIPRLKRTLEKFPDVPVALDHIALPLVTSGPPYADAQPLFELAKFPNLYIKFSTMSLVEHLDQGKSTTASFLGEIANRFGVKRMMWGSNYPASNDRSYKAMVDLAKESVSFLSPDEQRWVLRDTALSLWPLKK